MEPQTPQQQPAFQNPQEQYPEPQVSGPVQSPQNSRPPQAPIPGAKNKKLFIVIGAAVGFLVLVTVIAVLLSGGDKKPGTETPAADSTKTQLLEPSNALDIEQINNSVNQEMSNLSNDRDFPAEQLSDKALGL